MKSEGLNWKPQNLTKASIVKMRITMMLQKNDQVQDVEFQIDDMLLDE
jgi:hypothetical protein